jgi:mRNA-degrading endonuclease RelE of RelBE toxin-antitoxin system
MFEVYLSREAEKIYLKASPKTTRLLDNCFGNLELPPLFGPNIKRLKGKLEGSCRCQVGGMRVIYNVDIETKKVFVETIGARGDIYK